MKIKDCIKMAANPKYIGKISSIKYKSNTDDMIKPKDKDNTKAKG